jgi:hypothetical protein
VLYGASFSKINFDNLVNREENVFYIELETLE